MRRRARLVPGVLLSVSLLEFAPLATAQAVMNLTGLPAYPHLNQARMDAVARTDKMGHWCTRFAADTSDPLDAVEAWYRKALVNASETDLSNDERYRNYPNLTGIKLALGIDFVTVFRTADRSSTSIELFRCSAST